MKILHKLADMTVDDPELGKIPLVRRRGIRRLGIKVTLGGVKVNVPWYVPSGMAVEFFRANRAQVLQILEKLRQKDRTAMSRDENGDIGGLSEEETAELVERLRAEAKKVLPPRLGFLAARYGFKPNRTAIKHNRSNWGSCSTKGNINLNLNLMRVPPELRDYVILHELAHLRFCDHGPMFHALLENLCLDTLRRDYPEVLAGIPSSAHVHKELQKRLRRYRLV